MVSSRQAIAGILFSLALAACAHAQSSATKEQTASISGKVTLKNKGVAGIVVVAIETNHNGGSELPRYRATTDDEGNYRITDIPAGTYLASPLAPALAVDKAEAKRLLTVAAGESVRDFDFVMVRGGVITGRITNADGQPLVEEGVTVMTADSQPNSFPHNFGSVQTDDRGIYRAFGLRPGKYKVYVGQPARGLPGYMRQGSRQTFYPSVTEFDKATVIEVSEGGEINEIDIVAAGSLSTFSVSGRIIDSEGKPVSGGLLGVQQREGDSTMSSSGIEASNSRGEFKLLKVLPGKYTLFFGPPENSNLRAEPIVFEVIDSDVTGLELKTKKGASLSGMVVVEGSYEKSLAAMFKGLRVLAWLDGPDFDYETGSRAVEVGADGSFRLGGLESGNAHVEFIYSDESNARQFELQHVEHNGVIQPGGISIKDGEQVEGVRIVVRHRKLTGAIRGQVKIENGELTPAARILVWVNSADTSKDLNTSLPMPTVDSRGRFVLERLPAGTYVLRAAVFEPSGRRISSDQPKQTITVTDNAATEVTLTIKLKP